MTQGLLNTIDVEYTVWAFAGTFPSLNIPVPKDFSDDPLTHRADYIYLSVYFCINLII